MKTYFTKRAQNKLLSIKDYIAKEWGENATLEFENRIDAILDLIEAYPQIGMLEVPEKQIRGIQLSRQTRIFYRIKKNNIIILKKKPK